MPQERHGGWLGTVTDINTCFAMLQPVLTVLVARGALSAVPAVAPMSGLIVQHLQAV
jgi:hypothetical protein